MGYTLPETVADLTWDDRPGLEVEVVISPVPMGEYFDWHADILRLQRAPLVSEWAEWVKLSDRWTPKYLRGWTLPEPATAEGMRAQPLELVMAIMASWDRGVARVPVPLATASSPRATAAETNPPNSPKRRRSTTS